MSAPGRAALLLAALAAALLVVAFASTRGCAREAAPADPVPRSRTSPERPAVALVESSRTRSAAATDRPASTHAPGPAPEEDLPPEELLELDEVVLPSDPIQLGRASLDLTLVDAATGEPLAAQVELWRLDAPGNEWWSRGAQLQERRDLPSGGGLFARLPEGRYRIVSPALAREAPTPEVEVRAPRTRAEVALRLPRTYRLRLDLRDRWGGRVHEAEAWTQGFRGLGASAPWKDERRLLDPGLVDVRLESLAGEPTPPRATLGPQPDEGFDLGEHRGLDRGWAVQRILGVSDRRDAEARVELPPDAEGLLAWVAVLVSTGEVAARVRLPGGAPAPAQVEVHGLAVPRDPDDPAGAWRRAPVRIRASLDGYREVEVVWRPVDGELPWIVLVPLR